VVNGKIQDEWTVFNAMAAYSQVIAPLKWTLFGILLAFVVAIVGPPDAMSRSESPT
jgi:hypothetical protein